MVSADDIVRLHGLGPHPEGGFFRETYRSRQTAAFPGFPGTRSLSTAILFLLPAGAKSHLHRIRSDEAWHFHLGGPRRLVELAPDGGVRDTTLGADPAAGHRLQHVVPAGTWFGAEPLPGSPYSLVGCTVAPGFDFADFELGRRADLAARFPDARTLVEGFTG